MQLLKLLALDEQDLAIVSAHVQDAVMKVGDIAFLPREKRALFAMNRFAWEEKTGFFSRRPQRRRTALHFEGVTAMRAEGIDQGRADDVLSLLAVTFTPTSAPAGTLALTFSGGGTLALDVDYVEARLADLGPAWEAAAKPRHAV